MSIPLIKSLLHNSRKLSTTSLRRTPVRPATQRPAATRPVARQGHGEEAPSRQGPVRPTAVLLVIIALINVLPSVLAYNQDFNSFTIGRQPCTTPTFSTPCTGPGYTYTASGTTDIVTGTGCEAGNCLRMQAATNAVFSGFTGDVCSGFTVTLAAAVAAGMGGMDISLSRAAGSPSSAQSEYNLAITNSAGSISAILNQQRKNSAGAGVVTTSTSSLLIDSAYVANRLLHFEIDCPLGLSAGSICVYSPEAAAIGAGSSCAAVSANTNTDNSFLPNRVITIGTINSGNGFVDNLNCGCLVNTVAPPVIGAANTVAVTTLVGFDVDFSGRTAIARTNGGGTIRTFSGSGLNQLASDTTNCNISKAVFSQNTNIANNVAYLHCSSGSSVDSLRIATESLGLPPHQPAKCLEFPSNVCPYIITNADITQPDGHVQVNLDGITDFPIDYSRNIDDSCATSSCDDKTAILAFGFSTTTGDVGVSIINQYERFGDTTSLDLDTIGETSQPIDEMCITRDLDGKDYIYAVSTLTNVKGWRVDFHKENAGNVFQAIKYAPDLITVFPGTGSTAGAIGVACGHERFVILNSNSLSVWKCRTGCSSDEYTLLGLTSVPTGGVAMSDDGNTIAYVTGSTWHIINAENGTELASGSIPSGTFNSIKLHGAGSSLWIATSTTIARYATFTVVGNGTDQSYVQPCSGPTCSSTQTSSSGGGSGNGVVEGSGCTDRFTGEVVIGKTYVPIADWTNCASMAVETFLTISFLMFLGVLALAWGGARGTIAVALLTVLGVAGYMISIYMWQAPGWVIAVLIILGIASIFRSRA